MGGISSQQHAPNSVLGRRTLVYSIRLYLYNFERLGTRQKSPYSISSSLTDLILAETRILPICNPPWRSIPARSCHHSPFLVRDQKVPCQVFGIFIEREVYVGRDEYFILIRESLQR